MIKAFVDLLRRAAAVLAPFSEPQGSGSLRWDGTAYAPPGRTKFDPYAAKWWATLTAIAELLDGQVAPLSPQQKSYLERLLFGGMGSFNDFVLDEQPIGANATQANQELNQLRKAMFDEFRRV